MSDETTKLPAAITITAIAATSATTDRQLVDSWVASLGSAHSRRNFETTATRFLNALQQPLRQATVEDVRTALETLTASLASTSARQAVLRIKSLLTYGHRLGYLRFNAGVTIKVRAASQSVAKRILSEVEVGLLVRAAGNRRNRILIEVGYAGGLRVSELVALTWSDVLPRDNNRVQLEVKGKGGMVRQVLLPEVVCGSLLSLRGEAGPTDPVFRSQRTGGRLTERGVNHMLKATAERAGVIRVCRHTGYDTLTHLTPWITMRHWPRCRATLGHGNIATTSAYLHARPDSSSGLKLDPGVFLQRG